MWVQREWSHSESKKPLSLQFIKVWCSKTKGPFLGLQVHLRKFEYIENVHFSSNFIQKMKLSSIIDSLYIKWKLLNLFCLNPDGYVLRPMKIKNWVSKNNRILHKKQSTKMSTFRKVCPFIHTLKSACFMKAHIAFSSFVLLGLVSLIFPFDNSLYRIYRVQVRPVGWPIKAQ